MYKMENNDVSIRNLIKQRNSLAVREKQLYLNAVENLNNRLNELLKEEDFGTILLSNLGHDVAGEFIRRYSGGKVHFLQGNLYITVDQMFERVINFTYENDKDVLMSEENADIRKKIYNYTEEHSDEVKEIAEACEKAQTKLFEDRDTDKLESKSRERYRKEMKKESADGILYDGLTGAAEDKTKVFDEKTGKSNEANPLDADHMLPYNAITYNSQYIKENKIEELMQFYTSDENLQLIHKTANRSKKDIRVCEVKTIDNIGNTETKIVFIQSNSKIFSDDEKVTEKGKQTAVEIKDITNKATPEQLAEATIAAWESETKTNKKKNTLINVGYLDENGKVKPEVKKKLISNYTKMQNAESVEILKATDYNAVRKEAWKQTSNALGTIFAGQLIYYMLPPTIYEAKKLAVKKGMTIDRALKELHESGKRIIGYVLKKIGDIIKNVVSNTIDRFLKSFFEIIIEMLKATIKRMFKIAKDLVLSLVNCGKVLLDKRTTGVQKAEAITKIISVTITTIIVDLLVDQVAKFLPPSLVEPIQVGVTLLATNYVMLILQKLDLFDVRYGFLVSNIEKVFDEEITGFQQESDNLILGEITSLEDEMKKISAQIVDMNNSIRKIDIYHEEVTPYLQQFSDMFNMNIDFNSEWEEFVSLE